MKSVSYTSSQYLECSKCAGEVIVCISPDKTVSGQPFIEGIAASVEYSVDSCGRKNFIYGLSFEEGQLLVPSAGLVDTDINGVLCKGCLTDYIESIVPTPGGLCFVYNETDLIAAEASTSCNTIIVAGIVTLTANLTVTKSLIILNGFPIATNGFTLTLNGSFNAESYQCFDAAVVFGNGSVREVYAEWFGAVGNGIADDTTAMQAALDSASTAFFRVAPLQRKTYLVDTLIFPHRTNFGTDNVANTNPIIKSKSAAPLIVLPVANTQDGIRISGVYLNGNNIATSVIAINGNAYVDIHDCHIVNSAIGIDHRVYGGFWNRFYRNNFFNCTTGIYISTLSNYMMIHQNVFGGTRAIDIYSDTLNDSDSIEIVDNAFETACTTNFINLNTTAGFQGLAAVIVRNRFDGGPAQSMVYIGQHVQATVSENVFAGSSPYLIYIDGTLCDVQNNYLASAATAGIYLFVHSSYCKVGDQRFGLGGIAIPREVIDSGYRNNVRDNHVSTEKQLVDALSFSACESIILDAPITFTGNHTITKPCTLLPGAVITTNGFTAAFSSTFDAGLYQCFDSTVFKVLFNKGSLTAIYAEWFGAVGDGIVDDTNSFVLAFSSVSNSAAPVVPLKNKVYSISSLTLPAGSEFGISDTRGGGATIKGNAVSPLLVCATAGIDSSIDIHGLSLNGNSISTKIIDINGNLGVRVHDCSLTTCALGIDHTAGGRHNKFYRNPFTTSK